MRDFSEAWFGLSFSVQKATYIITLGKGFSFAECQGFVPNYLVVFHDIKRLWSWWNHCKAHLKFYMGKSWNKARIILKEQYILLVSFPSYAKFYHILDA